MSHRAIVYGADTIRDAIDERLWRLSQLSYDYDGAEALPLRPDAHDFIVGRLCGRVYGADFDGLPGPVLSLSGNGVPAINFGMEGRTLSLEVPCGGVVRYFKEFPDGTLIEGIVRIGDRPTPGQFDEISATLRWLAGRPS